MTIVFALALALGGDDPPDLPSIGDLAWQGQAPGDDEPPQFIGIEAFAVATQFDSGLRIDDAGGLGLDLNFRWRPRKIRFGFSLGFAGWNTENDEDKLPAASVRVDQYRVGVGVEFPFRFMEFGLASNVGVYRYRSSLDNDASPYCELEGSLGFVPIPQFKAGLLAVTSYTQSSFNSERTHLHHNFSIGVFAEVRF